MPTSLFTHPALSSPNPPRRNLREQPLASPLHQSTCVAELADEAALCPKPELSIPPTACASNKNTVGKSLLREYARHLDPVQINDQIAAQDAIHDDMRSADIADTRIPDSPKENGDAVTSTLSSAAVPPLPQSRSFLGHRKNAHSADGIPRQTLMKALASKSPALSGRPTPFPASLAGILNSPNNESEAASVNVSTTLSSSRTGPSHERTPSTARFPLKSPCFYHQRFDDAVDIEKVLDEIADDDSMSHSRLMQTATGVREVSKQLQRRPIKLAVRNVMIVTKARDNSLVCLTRELAEWLLSTPRYGSNLGVNVYVDAKLRRSKRFDAAGLLAKEPRFEQMLKYWTPDLCWTSPEKFDLVLTLGGDGTVLFTSWLFQRIVPPVLSFSLGSLGFLTNFEFANYKEHLNRVMGELGMRVNLRMRFTCTVFHQRPGQRHGAVEEGEQFEVVNELVIDRGPSPYVSNLELYGDNELLTVVQADGCIFSTPTGSTAYSLSAGGSLIHPSIPAILLTPICPHTLSFRPMVLSDTLLLRIAVPQNSRSTAYCSFDGKGRIELRQGDYVTVEASQYPFPTVVSGSGEWFDSVRRALRWNVRGAVQKGWNGSSGSSAAATAEAHDLDAHGVYTGDEEEEEQQEEWDIDTDTSMAFGNGTDSGLGPSENGDCGEPGSISPVKRQMSLLNM
ncbi:hypothetical protein AJ80_00645 [Polytolypa hystricis UAMH7299]|uniref:NAD+ kinase n=1 Tax=Polytolypa hystricis (strain UAMH7299) TaxID=1447883 RepID=A0A2B7Z3J5_POLH7|nr:hypothetical protein AJ80_00645 [Polytolypa hystricis UAMH7299]